jgi:hypothetical protein
MTDQAPQNQPVAQLETKWGLTAFVDILGYEEFVNTDRLQDVAKVIVDTFSRLPLQVRDVQQDLIRDPQEKDILEGVLQRIQVSIISDSILITLSLNREIVLPNVYAHFLIYVALIVRNLFIGGFPSRGCVSVGEYFVWENMIGGKAIVEAHKMSGQLNFAGCIVSDGAHEALVRASFQSGPVIFRHEAPVKSRDKVESRLNSWILNWLALPFLRWPELPTAESLEVVVDGAFRAHGKKVTADVENKIRHTNEILITSIAVSASFW